MKKTVSLLTTLLLTLLLLTGCSGGDTSSDASAGTGSSAPASSAAAKKVKINVAAIKGPTGVGMANLMKAADDKTAGNDYAFQVVTDPNEIVGKISNGDVDIAAVPTNLAASLYAKTNGKVKMLAVNTLGVLYIMENGETVKAVEDLKGKTIYSTGQGANPEYVLRYLLTKNGLEPGKDVTIEFLAENEELNTKLVSGDISLALVPEPNVTAVQAQKAELRVALDIYDEWNKTAGDDSKLMMGCVIARKEFIEEHPEAVKAFLNEYKTSIEKASSDLEGTAALCETYGIIPKAVLAKKAIPRCNLTYIDGNAMMEQIKGYFDVLFEANPKSLGGALPDESFYFLG